jgi:hypothetical protein
LDGSGESLKLGVAGRRSMGQMKMGGNGKWMESEKAISYVYVSILAEVATNPPPLSSLPSHPVLAMLNRQAQAQSAWECCHKNECGWHIYLKWMMD